ncbi:hypothetical protein EXIGLDRAFT_841035 [Exidia glandulosa HHB12029]|uniref:Uncharacterized protein n=1 Tax=Exidia glandulosa HHB12029 TaxID=1314781 RepID=A0A165E503_EXIGL|nr:hypothetical protein EXIGLDRAFT_841035 [Exidia glandulosa HHB12029]
MNDSQTAATSDPAPAYSADNKTSPPTHPDVLKARQELTVDAEERPGATTSRRPSSVNWGTAKKFLSAYAQTWVGMSPLWLMGEAIVPGQKVGGTFKKGARKLQGAALEVREAVSVSAKDVVVIIDERVQASQKGGVSELTKASEVIKAAGENALLVVTTSLEKVQQELQAHKELSPQLKRAVQHNSRDVIVLLDKGLRHPVVVTGISQFAKSKGIPHADALLRLASLGLTKILAAIPDVPLEGVEAVIEEVDAAELERTSTQEARDKAEMIGKSGDGAPPKVETDTSADPYAKMKKDNQCIVM